MPSPSPSPSPSPGPSRSAQSQPEAQPPLFEPVDSTLALTRTDLVDGVEFHPAVAAWFERRFPQGPSDPQRDGWPFLAQGRSTLIAAPTGSGKTLAGFLMCINRLYLEPCRR